MPIDLTIETGCVVVIFGNYRGDLPGALPWTSWDLISEPRFLFRIPCAFKWVIKDILFPLVTPVEKTWKYYFQMILMAHLEAIDILWWNRGSDIKRLEVRSSAMVFWLICPTHSPSPTKGPLKWLWTLRMIWDIHNRLTVQSLKCLLHKLQRCL